MGLNVSRSPEERKVSIIVRAEKYLGISKLFFYVSVQIIVAARTLSNQGNQKTLWCQNKRRRVKTKVSKSRNIQIRSLKYYLGRVQSNLFTAEKPTD